MRPSFYSSYEEFERQELRSSSKLGFTLDEMIEETVFDGELEFDQIDEE